LECEQADRNRPKIRQGDIIAAHPNTANWADPFRRFFVVVSADCDIANDKLETGLVVVPLIGLQTYVRRMWLPSYIASLERNMLKRGAAILASVWRAHVAYEEWLGAQNADVETRIAALIDGDDGNHRKAARTLKQLQEAAAGVKLAVDELDSAGLLPAVMARLANAKTIATGQSCAPDKELRSGIASAGDPKRVDLWPICDLIGLDSDMREEEADGFVAVFRYFDRLRLELVYVEKRAWLNDPDGYFRLCRLRGIYKTDFLQSFANLFVRVGLDSSRDSEHQQGFERAAKRLLREGK
jgi:hypothetical protein